MSESAWQLFDELSDRLDVFIERVNSYTFYIADRQGARLHGPFITNEKAAEFLMNGGGVRNAPGQISASALAEANKYSFLIPNPEMKD